MHLCSDELTAAVAAVPFLSLIPLYGRRACACVARLFGRKVRADVDS